MALPLSALVAQEHPSEHPKSAEHPNGTAAGVTKADLGAAIEAYVKAQQAKGGGTWEVEDKADNATLHLTLDKVHKDKLSMTAKDTYFACADFKNADGHKYDLDVFMTGPDKDHLTVTDVSVHKKDGKERYTWAKDGNIWKKVPA
jgi:hypothetical protein